MKKLQILENERRLKEERERISRDLHDSLGVYANAVLYNTELLEKEKTTEKGQPSSVTSNLHPKISSLHFGKPFGL
jgi:signal transduction histidine kinase